MAENDCPRCGVGYGWICSAHPDKPAFHDGCDAEAVTCDEPGCRFSLHGLTPRDPEAGERMRASIEARGGKVICSVWDDENPEKR